MSAADKKPAKTTKSPAKTAIVTSRPILKDPAIVDEDTAKKETDLEDLAHASGPKLQPMDKTEPAEPETKQQPEPKPEPEPETKPEPQPAETEDAKEPAPPEPDPAPEDKPPAKPKHDERDAAVQKLIDSKKYELPINAVEKRKARHFVVLGALLAILLALAWGDIAADAGLIHINGLKPVTHFFSN